MHIIVNKTQKFQTLLKKALIKWINLHKCNLINTSDINIYYSYSDQLSSVLDLTFTSKNMKEVKKQSQHVCAQKILKKSTTCKTERI